MTGHQRRLMQQPPRAMPGAFIPVISWSQGETHSSRFAILQEKQENLFEFAVGL